MAAVRLNIRHAHAHGRCAMKHSTSRIIERGSTPFAYDDLVSRVDFVRFGDPDKSEVGVKGSLLGQVFGMTRSDRDHKQGSSGDTKQQMPNHSFLQKVTSIDRVYNHQLTIRPQ